MTRVAARLAMVLSVGWAGQGAEDPEHLLERFLLRMKSDLGRLPNYVCLQTVDRFGRSNAEKPWQKVDTLRFDVAIVGDRELYGPPGARQFHDRPLAEVIGRGTVSTGRLGLMAQHVFGGAVARFSYRGPGESDGRPAEAYDYEVPPERSNYRLRSGSAEAAVGFQGTFWIDPENLDLIRLEVQAYDIPERIGLSEANTSLRYSRLTFDASEILLPVLTTVTLIMTDGLESLNRTQLTGCRRYTVESTLQFAGEPAPTAGTRAAAPSEESALPPGTLIELALESNLDPSTSSIGDPVMARVTRPVKAGEQELVPQGTAVLCRLVRLERQTMPFPIFEIGLELQSLELDGRSVPLAATMEEAGPEAGLLRQARRLDPKFTKRRTGRMDILVREVQRGHGILHWDARRGPLPRGLKMKWRVNRD